MGLQIRYYSDLHIDPPYFLPFDPPVMEGESEQVLVLAGDIAEYKNVGAFILAMSKRFKHVVYVFGNHEYYGTSISRGIQKTKGSIVTLNDGVYPDNISILEDEYVIIDDVAFIGATLWASMDNKDPFTMYVAQKRMNDYRRIRMPVGDGLGQRAYGSRLTAVATTEKHFNSRYYIIDTAQHIRDTMPEVRKTVVVSHHGPTKQSIQPSFRGDALNGAYVSELTDYIQITPIDLWFHGHVHHNFNYVISNGEDDARPTTVLANPRGYIMAKYPNQIENEAFDDVAVIMI